MTPSARRDLMSRNPWTSFLLGSGLLGLLGIAPAAAVSLNAVSPNPASPNRTVVAQVVTIIERDSDGPLVLELQRRLTELGIYDGPISGFFGELTEAAVIQFQQSQGLTADGIVGPTTAEALRAADSGGDPNRGESGTGALRRGDLGQRVTQLQQRLADLGFYSGAVDGDFGEATEAAVQRFQTARGLTVDGLVGSATQAALEQPAPQPADSSDSATRTPDPNDGLLERSESGDAVADLQRRLATLNYYDGPIDGSYGPQTEEAVSQFQADNNLATDGVAGPATLAAIEQSPAPVAEAPSGEPTATSQPVPEVASDSPVDNADNPAENSASNAPIEAVPIQPASPVVPTETAVVLPVRVDLSPEDIRVMQARLKDRGFYDGPVDGVLNDATREAIAAAQQAYEVSPGDLVISE